jgi:thiamine-monophosphate kinase
VAGPRGAGAPATVGELGEDALVARLLGRLTSTPGVLLGPGDDAAVVAAPDGRVVATTDLAVEDVHFRRAWSTAYDVGRKTAAANLADVMAMGGTASALLVGLVAPPDLPEEWALGLADGLRDEAALVGASVVGGDTVRGERVVVAVTALGDLGGRAPVRRSGARPGDVVVVSGGLGGSGAGLRRLEAGERTGPLVDAHRRPRPPYALGPALADLGATAMCDLSDGLLVDLGRLCAASGVGVELDPPALPRADGATLDDALHGGEDHALLATVPLGLLAAAEELGLTGVGRVRAGSGVVDTTGTPLVSRGWSHY